MVGAYGCCHAHLQIWAALMRLSGLLKQRRREGGRGDGEEEYKMKTGG